jgi:8-oxo-dGTP pyrophosphatase MutT (NUDIX family)
MSQARPDAIYDPRVDGPVRAADVKPVRARDASTLIIVRRDAAKPRVLMGRRNAGHSFMPDKWVFPGGRIDRSDFRAPLATDLRPDVAARLEVAASPARARALALCAVRETFEETGLLLAHPAPARAFAGPWRTFLAHGALADLAALEVIARAVTPTYRTKRFDARFFMADAERLLSLERLPDCGELDEIAWVDLDEAARLDLPNITRFVVQELALRLDDPARPAPLVRMRNGVRKLAYF